MIFYYIIFEETDGLQNCWMNMLQRFQDWNGSSVVKLLFHMHDAAGSSPSTAKQNNNSP